MTDLTICFIILMGLIFIFGIAIMVSQKRIFERYDKDYHDYLNYLREWIFEHNEQSAYDDAFAIDCLNEYHFDYCGLIDKGLAIEVTENNNPYKD